MDKHQIAEVIRRRLNLEDRDWSVIEKNPKFQMLFQDALEASRYRLVAEVIDSIGCHSGHVLGQKIIFDNSGNLLTKENPDRICAFLMPNMTVLINAFFENLMNGRDPNEVMFNTTGCFDTGPHCGGWGYVTVRMTAELKALYRRPERFMAPSIEKRSEQKMAKKGNVDQVPSIFLAFESHSSPNALRKASWQKSTSSMFSSIPLAIADLHS